MSVFFMLFNIGYTYLVSQSVGGNCKYKSFKTMQLFKTIKIIIKK